jgi:glutathione synthase/RimK-type ligase-like ATP-grasp enzyme
MSDGVYLFENEEKSQGYFTYTESLSSEDMEGYPEKISPSFIQSKIEKQYEVRVFYLDGRFFSWAIFSQSDTQTRTDYRKYNDQRPNRVVPYVLPETLQQQLIDLFRKIDLNTGSVDLMVDFQGTYYFLEINPTGQFGVLSRATNYQLEAEIARWLINHAQH